MLLIIDKIILIIKLLLFGRCLFGGMVLTIKTTTCEKLEKLYRISQIFVSLDFDIFNLKLIERQICTLSAFFINDAMQYFVYFPISWRIKLHCCHKPILLIILHDLLGKELVQKLWRAFILFAKCKNYQRT